MSQGDADFLVVGSSMLAQLLAGLLAAVHGKTVLLQGGNLPGTLHGGLDLSVGAITRPESWALLAAVVPETARLVVKIGKRAALTRLDPIIFADGAAAQEGLGHIRHMAAAHGLAAERTPALQLGRMRAGLVLRDAAMLRRPLLAPALHVWLNELGVRRPDPDAPLHMEADGRAQGTLDGSPVDIGQTVLADDAAMLAHLPESLWPALLQRQPSSAILTPPLPPIAAPVMLQLDSGITLHQQAEGGVLACGPGSIAELAAQLRDLLGLPGAFEQAGQSSRVRLLTSDGAPAVGRVAGTGPDVLAGLGPVGAFLAPAVARWLCGTATARENAWFAARLVDRHPNGTVTEIGAHR